MNIDFDKVRFESVADIVNYVTKGRIPSKKNFDALIEALSNSQGIVIPEGIVDEQERNAFFINEVRSRDQIKMILTQAYENRRKNRRTIITLAAILGLGLITGGGAIAFSMGKHSGSDTDVPSLPEGSSVPDSLPSENDLDDISDDPDNVPIEDFERVDVAAF